MATHSTTSTTATRSRGARAVQLAMFAVVVSFVLSTAFSQLLLRYDVDAVSIASNAAPSVAALADARAALRPLADAAEESSRAVYAQRRARLEELLAAYRRMPAFPGEDELYAPIAGLLARLDGVAGHRGSAPAGELHQQVDSATDAIDRELQALSALNHARMRASAQAIVARARRFSRYAFALDGVAIVIAVIATWLVAQAIRRYERHLERRSTELEHLAVQVGHEIANPLTPLQLAVGLARDQLDNAVAQRSFERAERSLARIRGSIDGLTAFAKSGIPPDAPLPPTPLRPMVADAAAGVTIAGDRDPRVQCEPPVLRQVIGDLVRATATPPSALLRVEIAHTIRGVRLTFVSSRAQGRREPDPFEPMLLDLPSGHPGIDLRLATVRRLVEARDGTVGFRDRKSVRLLWIELRGG